MAGDRKRNEFGIGRGDGPIVTTGQLGKILNITTARISQLNQEGILKKEERGRYNLYDSIHNYIKFLQERKVNQWDSREESQTDLKREQLRRTKEEADKLALLNARSRGELVEVTKVKRMGEKVMSAIKTKILNMPLTDDEKDKCLSDLLSLRDIDFSD